MSRILGLGVYHRHLYRPARVSTRRVAAKVREAGGCRFWSWFRWEKPVVQTTTQGRTLVTASIFGARSIATTSVVKAR